MKGRIAMCKGDASYASRSFNTGNVFGWGGTTDAAGTGTEGLRNS